MGSPTPAAALRCAAMPNLLAMEHERNMSDERFVAFREVTGPIRPPASHGCPPVEVVPGLWTAHYHDGHARRGLCELRRA